MGISSKTSTFDNVNITIQQNQLKQSVSQQQRQNKNEQPKSPSQFDQNPYPSPKNKSDQQMHDEAVEKIREHRKKVKENVYDEHGNVRFDDNLPAFPAPPPDGVARLWRIKVHLDSSQPLSEAHICEIE